MTDLFILIGGCWRGEVKYISGENNMRAWSCEGKDSDIEEGSTGERACTFNSAILEEVEDQRGATQ